MQKIQEKDLVSLKQIVKMDQPTLHRTLLSILQNTYGKKNVRNDRYFIYAKGEIPIALVAHMDTVFKYLPAEIYFDEKQGVLWSPQGLGADDRAGVYSILKILSDGYKPHIIFTEDEEKGGIGANALARFECPFKDIKYIIELDRRGANDCVFYGCDNKEFTDYIENFGFVTAFGSYSDISDLGPAWDLAAVNLSVGYRDEHTTGEVLFTRHMLNTIKKVERMLDNPPKDSFVFIPGSDYYFDYCASCHKLIDYYDCIPVKDETGVTKYYCSDCISDVEWCNICYRGFKRGVLNADKICPSCKKEGYKDYADYLERTKRKYSY